VKKILSFLFLLILGFSNNFAQVEVSTRLMNALQSAKENDYIRGLVYLRDQVDLLALDQRLYHSKATLEQRAYTVITELQRKAAETQTNLINYLQSKESSGDVFQFKSFWIANMLMIEAKPSVYQELMMRMDIAEMDLDALLELERPVEVGESDEGNSSETVEIGLRVIKAPQLWAMGITGQGRLLMNIDTGVYPNHPAYWHKWRGNFVPANQAWFDPVGGTTTPNDCDGHGSHTIGTMVGRSTTTPDTIGVAIDAQWIAAKTICSSPHTSNSIAAFQWAMNPDNNPSTITDMPDAISCSWHDPNTTNECSGLYKQTFDAVETAGIAIVFSAGNQGPNPSTITRPKNINTNEVNVFAVAAIDASLYNGGNNNPVANFSSRGPSTCGGTGSLLIKPEVSAPGVNVRSSGTATGYNQLSGTSMAAPHVAGAVGLLKQFAPNLTGHQIKMALYNTAIDLGTPGEDNTYGKGIIDLVAALQSLGNPDTIPPTPITNLQVVDPTSNSLRLIWTAPFDTSIGGVIQYDIRRSLNPITDTTAFYNATPITFPGAPGSAGSPQELIVTGLNFNTTYYFAVRSRDAWGNWSNLSNSASGTTLGAPSIGINPTSMTKILLPQQTVIDSVTITNTAVNPSTLNFNVSLENNTFPGKALQVQLVPKNKYTDANAGDKESPKEVGGISLEGQGGPDPFGYRWIDSNEPNGPQYVWNDIRTNPNAVDITNNFTPNKDDGYQTIPLGITFPFYGTNYTTAYLSTNGFLSFTALTSSYLTNAAIPSTALPNNIIAAFWDDLDGRTQGTVHRLTEGNKTTIQFTNWQKYNATGSLTFQIVLFSSGRIMIYYNTMNAVLNSATVGIENATGTVGLQVVFNANYVQNNMALKIEAAPEWLIANRFSGMLYSGNSVAVQLTFKAEDFPMGNYSMDMVITSNSPTNPTITVPIQMQIAIPVELGIFRADAQKDRVKIEWETITETNNSGFEVQRKSSTSSGEWEVIGFVQGTGTTTQVQRYQYFDNKLKAGKYSYRLKQIDYDGRFSYSREVEVEVDIPSEYGLSQNYPNPFNPLTNIEFSVPEKSVVRIDIYSALGELVRRVIDKEVEAGYHSVSIDGSQLPSGTYIYQMTAQGKEKSFIQSKKMTLIK